jgi:hypothetical protein
MPKFGSLDKEPTMARPAMDELPPFSSYSTSSSRQYESESAQLARVQLEEKQWEAQNSKQEETWIKSLWRPAMGWLYMAICAFDFIIAPIISMFIPLWLKGTPYEPWESITLENGGMIHLSFGAILGVTAWTRGQEKLAGKL